MVFPLYYLAIWPSFYPLVSVFSVPVVYAFNLSFEAAQFRPNRSIAQSSNFSETYVIELAQNALKYGRKDSKMPK